MDDQHSCSRTDFSPHSLLDDDDDDDVSFSISDGDRSPCRAYLVCPREAAVTATRQNKNGTRHDTRRSFRKRKRARAGAVYTRCIGRAEGKATRGRRRREEGESVPRGLVDCQSSTDDATSEGTINSPCQSNLSELMFTP